MGLSRDEIFKIIEDVEDEYWHDPDMNNEHKNWIMAGMIEEKLNAPGNSQQQVQLDSEQKQGTFDNPADAAVSVAPRELT